MAANSLEYIFSLTDKVSGKLNAITVTSDTTLNTFASLQTKTAEVNRIFNDTGRSAGALKQKLELLKAEKEWLPANNITAAKAYNKEIKSVTKEIDKLENIKGGGFKKWVGNLTSAVPALNALKNPIVLLSAGMLLLNKTVKTGEDAWMAQIEAETKLQAVMKNSMDATRAEVDSILKLAAAQQEIGVIGDEIQIAGLQELATYATRRDSLEKLLPLMNDMTAQQFGYNATQEQAVTIATMMGKVMQGQTGALSRYGYAFTEAQEKILKYGTETERAATLAEVIGEAVGGVNKALAETPEGKWKQQSNSIGDVYERVGKLSITFKSAFLPAYTTFVGLFDSLVQFIEANSDKIVGVISGVASIISKTFGIAASIVKTLFGFVSSLWKLFADGNPVIWGITAAVTAYTAALGINYVLTNKALLLSKVKTAFDAIQAGGTWLLTAAQTALNAAFYASPLGWIAAAIGVVVGAVVLCWQKFEGFRKTILSVWEVIKEFGKSLYNAVLDPIKKILGGIGALGKAIKLLFEGDFSGAWESAKQGAKDVAGGVLGASPAAVVYNAVKDGDYAGAWEKGQQAGAKSWQDSQDKKREKEKKATTPAAIMPDLPTITGDPRNSLIDPKKTKKINLGDLSTVQDLNTSSTYAAIAQRLIPKQVNFAPAEVTQMVEMINKPQQITQHNKVINQAPALAATKKADDSKQSYEPKKDKALTDIMFNVRKIAAAAAIPLTIATATPQNISAAALPEANRSETIFAQTTEPRSDGKTIRLDKFCDSIIIKVENTDNKGTAKIKDEVYKALNEIFEA